MINKVVSGTNNQAMSGWEISKKGIIFLAMDEHHLDKSIRAVEQVVKVGACDDTHRLFFEELLTEFKTIRRYVNNSKVIHCYKKASRLLIFYALLHVYPYLIALHMEQ
jgi:hypothetical protein